MCLASVFQMPSITTMLLLGLLCVLAISNGNTQPRKFVFEPKMQLAGNRKTNFHETDLDGQSSNHIFKYTKPNRDRYLASASDTKDIYQAAESSGYGHKGKHQDVSGYLDAGAYSGGYGAFGWYADYPVGGGYHK